MTSECRTTDWKTFRAEIIELDGGACRCCGRTASRDGVVLQVHHKRYVKGRKAWEYPPADCETLCKGCHAGEHGHIEPAHGWEYLGDSDLGSLSGCCERCQTSIRYEFYVFHEKWGTKIVGTSCCDMMTGTLEASEQSRFNERRNRFVSSTRWKESGDSSSIKQGQFEVRVVPASGGFRIFIDNRGGKLRFSSPDAAKRFVFDFIESGAALRWASEVRPARRPR